MEKIRLKEVKLKRCLRAARTTPRGCGGGTADVGRRRRQRRASQFNLFYIAARRCCLCPGPARPAAARPRPPRGRDVLTDAFYGPLPHLWGRPLEAAGYAAS